mmetsp:Transcript_12114/g.32600  ORF Transcript_12114/g.32600 Transcript_12114/m.32600 type:complete len:599 (-) Transcript_12114:59-1855(-)|eukprot:CAMPEP_0185829802 /NCGR_PEP_ID=MMETSP1353-20130828/460_1 /TAXON_ID=1077150 /ORGANISM="Erythrolobus australicus, Strain CCMP3124" /LENGTH=598 /DNA_ID=CAMNT_0028527631 /DNA_START=42 /DNA_END=1838 /DNA_ORIENTATION=+
MGSVVTSSISTKSLKALKRFRIGFVLCLLLATLTAQRVDGRAPARLFGTARRVARSSDGLLQHDVLRSREYKPLYGTNDATDCAADNNGNIFLTGSVIGRGAFPDQKSSASTRGGTDIFLARASYESLEPTLFRQIGSEADDHATSLAVSPNGASVFIGGWTRGAFELGAERSRANSGDRDCLLLKLSPAGVVRKAKQFGSSGRDYIEHVAYSDDDKSLTVVGHIEGAVVEEPRFFAGEKLSGKLANATGFVAKFDDELELIWGRHVGISGRDTGTAVLRGGDGSVYLSFASFNDRGSVFTIVEKIDPSGTTVWRSDTDALYISAGRNMAFYKDKLVLSTTFYVNDVYKLSVIAIDSSTGKLVESLSGCCDDGFAKASGGVVVTSNNRLFALGHHSDRRSGLGAKSPLIVTIDQHGDPVSRKLTKISTTENDARMTRPTLYNNTLYFASSNGASFWLHSFTLANISEGSGTDFGAGNGGSALSGGGGEGSGNGISNLWAIIGTILGALAAAGLLVAGVLLYSRFGGSSAAAAGYNEVPRKSTALTPYQTPFEPARAGSRAPSEHGSDHAIDIEPDDGIVDDDARSHGSDPVVYRFSPV